MAQVQLAHTADTNTIYNHLLSLIWHDSVFYQLIIGRHTGEDIATFDLKLLVDSEQNLSQRVTMTLSECLTINTQFFGGIIGLADGEMIDDVDIKVDGPVAAEILSKWPPQFGKRKTIQLDMSLGSGSKLTVVFSELEITSHGPIQSHSAPPHLSPKP